MIELIQNLLRRSAAAVTPQPAVDAVPDMTGRGLTIDYWASALGENRHVPNVGDVIVRLVSCSMGMTVSRDIRYRVTGPGPYPKSVIAETPDGKTDILHAFNMRPHGTISRTWVLPD